MSFRIDEYRFIFPDGCFDGLQKIPRRLEITRKRKASEIRNKPPDKWNCRIVLMDDDLEISRPYDEGRNQSVSDDLCMVPVEENRLSTEGFQFLTSNNPVSEFQSEIEESQWLCHDIQRQKTQKFSEYPFPKISIISIDIRRFDLHGRELIFRKTLIINGFR